MKKPSKGLKGFKQISESEEIKSMLPPGSQIMPEFGGGTTIFIPNGSFSPEVPDFRGPWGKYRKEIYRFEVMAACDGMTPMPAAQTSSDEINAQCDQWIKDYYKAKDRSKLQPPKEIAPWLVARAMTAGMLAAMDETHGVSAPTESVETIMLEFLVDYWNDVGRYTWYGIHPDASAHSE